jgi:hypothetical protein
MPTILTPAVPNERKLVDPNRIAVPISVCFLIFFWYRNYNLLGAFYDYSIVTSAVGHLHSGLFPYRDFTTPLQSLTPYLCDAAELVFGRHYLTLAYANLIFGLLGYFMLLLMLKPAISFLPRVVIATAFSVSTFFQHGILWYNSIAMLLLALTALQAAKLVDESGLSRQTLLKLCGLLFLSSMNKLNFHALGLGLVTLAFASHCLLHKTGLKSVFLFGGSLAVSGLVLGPAFEILLNRTTLSDFIENVIRTPAGRRGELHNLLNPNLYLGKMQEFYPDNWISGVFLIGFLIYVGCFCVIVWPPRESTGASAPINTFVKFCALIMFPLLFFAALFLTVTNFDTEILTSFFLVIGLASALVVLAKYLLPQQQFVFQFAITILSAFFLLAGGASTFMHSRIRYGEPPWTSGLLRAFNYQQPLSAMRVVVPFFNAETISPELEPYFAGVRFTEPAKKQLSRVVSFMDQFQGGKDTRDIYWGPGLEILSRVYGGHLGGRLPLWYHLDVTVRQQDAARVNRELGRARYEWIVAANIRDFMPSETIAYIQKSYECVEDDEIKVYHRRP